MSKVIFEGFPNDQRRTWAWATPVLTFTLFIGGQILSILPVKFLGLITKENVEVYPYFLYFLTVSFMTSAVLLWLWIKWFERSNLESVGLQFNSQSWRRYARGFALGLAFGIVIIAGILAFGGYERESTYVFEPAYLVPILLLMFGFMIQSGVEELIFRGWMLSRIAARYGVWAGVIGNSLVFSAMHLNPGDMSQLSPLMIVMFTLTTFLFSIFLSLYVVREGSIWGACAWHASWNWIFITWFGLPTTGIPLDVKPLVMDLQAVDGAPEWLTGGFMGPEDSIVTASVLALACVSMLYKVIKYQRAMSQSSA